LKFYINGKISRHLIILLTISILFYLDVFFNSYISDDYSFLNDINSLKDIFPGVNLGFFRPMVRASFYFEFLLFGKSPLASHGVNLMLHLLAVIISYLLVRNLFGDEGMAFFASLIFSLYFTQIEVVTWVSARSESLVFIFGMTFILLFRKKWYFASLLFFLLGLLSKESGIVFLFILGVMLISERNSIWVLIKRLFPFFIMLAGYLLVYRVIMASKEVLYLSRPGLIVPSLYSYLGLFILPDRIIPVFWIFTLFLLLFIIFKGADYRFLVISLTFLLFPLLLVSYSYQLFYRYRCLYTPCLGFSMIWAYILIKLAGYSREHKANSTRFFPLVLAAVLAFLLGGFSLYNSYEIKRDYFNYSMLYRELGHRIKKNSAEKPLDMVVLSNFPRVLGRTRLFFLMPEDMAKYVTGHDIRVFINNEKLPGRLVEYFYNQKHSFFHTLKYCMEEDTIVDDESLNEAISELAMYISSDDILYISVNIGDTDHEPVFPLSRLETSSGFSYEYITDLRSKIPPPFLISRDREISMKVVYADKKEAEVKGEKGFFILYDMPGYMEKRISYLKIGSENQDVEILFDRHSFFEKGDMTVRERASSHKR